MNWVEMDRRRDEAVAAKGEIVWGNVCAAVKDAVDSFNREYRQSKSELKSQSGPSWISLSIQLPSRGEPTRGRYAIARISFDRKHHIIYCKFTKSNAPEVTIGFEAGDDSGQDDHLEVFLRSHPAGPRIKDEEAASRLMLRQFLKGIENA
jgi:hypothetical protein